MTTCEECGFVYEDLSVSSIPERLRSLGPRYAGALGGAAPSELTRRPRPEVWSGLEYTCHVRDVLLTQRDRIVLIALEETPRLARMYRDERVTLCRYDAHRAPVVLEHLAMAAELCATVFEGLDEASLARTFLANWPSESLRDLVWLGRHTVHEGEHHLADVARVLAAPGSPLETG